MTNREAYNNYHKVYNVSTKKLNTIEKFLTKTSPLYKHELKSMNDSVREMIIIMAKTHSLDEKFFEKMKDIIDAHPNNKEFWNWCKMTSIGHL